MITWGWQWQAESLPPLAYWSLLVGSLILLILGFALNAVILRKAGHSGWWAALFLFPVLYAIGIWVFAWSRWPRQAARVPYSPPPEPRAPPPGMV